jgi:hypothetical protein
VFAIRCGRIKNQIQPPGLESFDWGTTAKAFVLADKESNLHPANVRGEYLQHVLKAGQDTGIIKLPDRVTVSVTTSWYREEFPSMSPPIHHLARDPQESCGLHHCQRPSVVINQSASGYYAPYEGRRKRVCLSQIIKEFRGRQGTQKNDEVSRCFRRVRDCAFGEISELENSVDGPHQESPQ